MVLHNYSEDAFYLYDPLWDGEGCRSTSTCCEFNTPPWFYKSLPQNSSDNLELRLCGYHFKYQFPQLSEPGLSESSIIQIMNF